MRATWTEDVTAENAGSVCCVVHVWTEPCAQGVQHSAGVDSYQTRHNHQLNLTRQWRWRDAAINGEAGSSLSFANALQKPSDQNTVNPLSTALHSAMRDALNRRAAVARLRPGCEASR